MPRHRTQLERDRQRIRQRMQRLQAKCLFYGIEPWEFYYWTELRQQAQYWANDRATGKITKHVTFREWISRHYLAYNYKENLLTMLEKMGKVIGERKH